MPAGDYQWMNALARARTAADVGPFSQQSYFSTPTGMESEFERCYCDGEERKPTIHITSRNWPRGQRNYTILELYNRQANPRTHDEGLQLILDQLCLHLHAGGWIKRASWQGLEELQIALSDDRYPTWLLVGIALTPSVIPLATGGPCRFEWQFSIEHLCWQWLLSPAVAPVPEVVKMQRTAPTKRLPRNLDT